MIQYRNPRTLQVVLVEEGELAKMRILEAAGWEKSPRTPPPPIPRELSEPLDTVEAVVTTKKKEKK